MMEEITADIKEKLLEISIVLRDIQSLSRIMQACLDDKDNLKSWDLETIFEVIKSKIADTKRRFSEIEVALSI